MKRIHIKRDTINLAKLVNSIGYERTAESLGVTSAAIKKYIKVGKAPQATEIAAEAIAGKQSLSISNDVTAIIRGRHDIIDIVKKVVESNNGTWTNLSI